MPRAFGILLFLIMLPCAAAPFAVQVGEAHIGLDAPPGFADSAFTGSPRLQELAESQTSPSNRILMFAISDGDLRRFTVGDTPEFRRYMIVVTPRALERERLGFSGFKEIVATALGGAGAPPASGDLLAHLDAQPAGKASLLAELRREPDVVSVLQGTRIPGEPQRLFGEARPRYVLSTQTLMLLRGKALTLTAYTLFDSPADLDWIRTTTARWVEDLQRLNSR